MAGNTSFTDLISTTLQKYIPKFEEQVFTSKPFSWILKNSGSIVDDEGGRTIVVPLMYAEAPNVGSYSGTDTFTTLDNTGLSAAEFDWKQFYGLMHFTGLERAQNSGPQAVLSLLRARLEQLELTMAEKIEEMLLADGSGNAGKDFYGLEAIIDSGNPSWGNLGGIDRTATGNGFWQSTETAVGGALTLAGMATLYNTISEGNDHPTNILTDQDEFEAYEALLTSQIRFEDAEMADGGFQTLMYKGAPITFSGNVTAGVMYMMNMKYIELRKLASVWFKPSDVLQPTNQDAYYQHLLCYGNLTVSNCKRQGKLTGLTD